MVFIGGCFRELFHTQASLRSEERGGAASSVPLAMAISPPLAGGDCCERRSADISSSSWLLLGLLFVLLILMLLLMWLLLDGEGMRAEKRRLIRSYMLVHHDACDSKIKKLGDRLSRCEELG